MKELICKTNDFISGVVWGPPMIVLILAAGIYLSVKTKFFQLNLKRAFKGAVSSIKSNKKGGKNSISPFASMSAALGGTLGTGNIAGVATALTAGGAGAIFWMWISAVFGMITKYSEVLLACVFRQKDKNGAYYGGPMYYMKYGLGAGKLAVIFSVICVFASFGMGNMVQTNAVAASLCDSFRIPAAVSGAGIAVMTAVIISGGMKRITGFTSKLVPVMGIAYTVGALIIIAVNITSLPVVLHTIFSQAFRLSSVTGGTAGYVMSNAVRYGVARGIFSNEAGLGSAPMAHAAADFDSPVKQAMWGIFEVFFDTVCMCTLTAFAILCSGAQNSGADGAALTNEAFSSVFGDAAKYILSVFMAFFALSSVICWAYYGETALKFLFKKPKRIISVYRVAFVLLAFFGCTFSVKFVFDISDTLNGLMAIPNIAAVLLLSPVVVKYTKDYVKRGEHRADK